MKKTILFIAAIAFVSSASFAQDQKVAPPADNVAVQAEDAAPQKKQVAEADLPAGVKNALTADQYKEWKVASAWLITEGKNEYYVLEMEKGEEKTTLKMNKDGKTI